MAIAITGVLTLIFLVISGPIAFFIIAQRNKNTDVPLYAAGTKRLSLRSIQGEQEERDTVSNINYLMSLLGFAIGIGNLWRFPYLVGKYGGGAFVFAYLVCLVLVSMPAFFIEMVMGQYTRMSTIACFKSINPSWTGLGYAQFFLLFMALSYYNILLVYAVIYMVGSIWDPLPWAKDSKAYWQDTVLNNYCDPECDYEGKGMGPIQTNLALGLAFVWVFIFVSLAFGKEALAKVTWVTVVGPIVMLAILLLRVIWLEGAWDGISFYILKFESEQLFKVETWAIACGQILFSLSPGFGTAITMSSFTTPKTNVFRTCISVALANSTFSLIGGFAIFSIVGNYTFRINEAGGVTMPDGHQNLTTVAEQAGAGAGLAFITIADAMSSFGFFSNIMSVLFFATLFTLGLDSTFAWVETFVSIVEDFAKEKFNQKPNRIALVAVVCFGYFGFGLIYATRMGFEMLDIIDRYVSSYYLLFGVFIEAILFTFDFGWRRAVVHVKRATIGNEDTPEGQNIVPEFLWRAVIPTTVPLLSIGLFCSLLYDDITEAYGGYPYWMQAIGWTLLIIIMSIAPVGGCLEARGYAKSGLRPLEDDELELHNRMNGAPARDDGPKAALTATVVADEVELQTVQQSYIPS